MPPPDLLPGLNAVRPASIDDRFAVAMGLYRAGAIERAEAGFRAVVASSPGRADAHMMLGAVAARSGRALAAIESLERAVRIRPGLADAHLMLGCALRDVGRTADGIAALRRAAGLAARDPIAWSELGLGLLVAGQLDEAAGCFERAIGLKRDFAAAHYNLAVVAERQRRTLDAIAGFRTALSHAPGLAEAHCRLGGLLHASGQRVAALASLSEAHRLQPRTTLGRLCLAKTLLIEGKARAAESCLRTIVGADDRNAEAHRLLGNTLRERGCFREAIVHLERALALDPSAVSAWHDLAHSRRHGEDDRGVVARMQAHLDRPGMNAFECSILHFALGKALDDLGEWRQAAEHFESGNRIEHGERRFDEGRYRRLIAGLMRECPDRATGNALDAGDPSEVPILIVGLPRSGTTLVEQILSSHARVAAGGEITFWDEQAAPRANGRPDRAAPPRVLGADYVKVLRAIDPGAERVTDKLPFNFLWLGLIHAALPNARIIHCRRHPGATGLSIFQTRFATRQDWAYSWRDIGIYQAGYRILMEHWRSVLPADRLIEIDYEALISSRHEVTRRMLSFCGLDWDAGCAEPERNNRVVRTASMWQARQPVYATSVDRWRRYAPFMPALDALSNVEAGHAAFRAIQAGPE